MGKTGKVLVAVVVAIGLAAAIGRTALSRIQTQTEPAKRTSSSHSVTLNWKPTPDASFYYVYRSTMSGSQYQKIGTSPTPTFKDAPVPSGAVFYYVVTAVVKGRESKYSNEIKAVVPK